jgi:hypothetical protein
MKVYLSGAITNDPDYVRKFKNIEETLTKLGYEVVNPVELCAEINGYAECMKADLRAMLHCNLVCDIEDGYESMGRNVELLVAETVGLPVLKSGVLTTYFVPRDVKLYTKKVLKEVK